MSDAAAKGIAGKSRTLVDTGYTHIPNEDLVVSLAKAMLYSFRETYRADANMTQRIESAYKKLFHGVPMMPTLPKERLVAYLLLGTPGQGKTSMCKAASKLVADAMGLRFMENAPEGTVPTKDDFYFVSQEMAGETSKAEFGGLMTKKKIPVPADDGSGATVEVEYMTRVINERIAKSAFAGAGMFLLDDFTNASPNIQNLALSITEEKRFNNADFSRFFIAVTGNLGALDGTTVNAINNAQASRLKVFYIEDTVEEFTDRMRNKYNDEIGTGHLLGFLSREGGKEHFSKLPDKRGLSFPCPRAWESALHDIRLASFEAEATGKDMSTFLPTLKREISACVGAEAANAYIVYVTSCLKLADPLAKTLIDTGKLDMKKFEELMGACSTPDQIDFVHMFSHALAEHCVRTLHKGAKDVDVSDPASIAKWLQPAYERYIEGAHLLPERHFTLGFEVFKRRLFAVSEKFYTSYATPVGGGNFKEVRTMNNTLGQVIAGMWAKHLDIANHPDRMDLYNTVVGIVTEARNLGVDGSSPQAKVKPKQRTPQPA